MARLTLALIFAAVAAPAAMASGNPVFAPDSPPIVARITLSQPNAQNEVTITGGARAVLANSYLAAMDLDTGHSTTTRAAADGSFKTTLIAPAGTSVEIKVDPQGKSIATWDRSSWAFFGALPGTIIRVPEPALGSGPIPFAGAGLTSVSTALPYFTVEGTINRLTFQAGETVAVESRVTLRSAALANAGRMTADVNLSLARVTTAEGHEIAMQNTFASTFMTPTGLPIERTLSAARRPFNMPETSRRRPATARS